MDFREFRTEGLFKACALPLAPRVAVWGLGRANGGDSRAGLAIVDILLESFNFPRDTVVRRGAPRRIHLSASLESVLIVSAANIPSAAPGKIQLVPATNGTSKVGWGCAGQEADLRRALRTLQPPNVRPADAFLLGIKPGELSNTDRLSRPVLAALPRLEVAILSWLSARDVHPEQITVAAELA